VSATQSPAHDDGTAQLIVSLVVAALGVAAAVVRRRGGAVPRPEPA
jgi:hypothetical protein